MLPFGRSEKARKIGKLVLSHVSPMPSPRTTTLHVEDLASQADRNFRLSPENLDFFLGVAHTRIYPPPLPEKLIGVSSMSPILYSMSLNAKAGRF